MYFILAVIILIIIVYYLFFSSNSQVFGKVYHRVKTDRKIVFLTFDDGPNEPYTSELLAILKRHNIKATFFVCGACIERWPGIVKQIHEDGHIIGNHSHAHKFFDYFNMKKYKRSVVSTNNLIIDEIGIKPIFYRSRWLFRTPGLLKFIKSVGLIPIWGYFGSELEVFQPKPSFMVNRAINLLKPGRIIIFHDGKESVGGNRANTITTVDLLVPLIKNHDFEIVPLDLRFQDLKIRN